VTLAYRANGRITGTKAGAAVTIELQQYTDPNLQVTFGAPESKETIPKLGGLRLSAYDRRMGR
jgi:hypothetical protein